MVTVVGYARTNTGDQIPLRNDSVTNGTEFSLQTDTNLTTTAQDIGTYKPGATVTSLEVFCPNSCSYAYILRQGVIVAWAVPNVAGVSNNEAPLSNPVVLRPGDTIRVLSLGATARAAALMVQTTSGLSRIFVGTPSGAGTTQLNDLQDSNNSIGDTLQGTVISQAAFLSIDGSKIVSSGGAWIRNASGQLAAAVPSSDPTKVEPMISQVSVPIALNYTASVVTSS